MDVMNGSQPDNGRCNSVHGIKTRVVLTCNSSVEWKTNDLTGLIRVAYQEAIDPCQVCKQYRTFEQKFITIYVSWHQKS